MNKNKLFIALAFLIAILASFSFYMTYPAINIQSITSITWMSFFIASVYFLFIILKYGNDFREKATLSLFSIVTVAIFFAIFFIGQAFYSPVLQSKQFANRINIVTGDFINDIKEVDLNNLPLLDRASTEKVGDRVMGQLPELISQFNVSNQYTQISYKGRLVRVTPLEYNGFFKWLGNKQKGVPGYIIVDSTTGEANLIKLEKGLKYVPGAFLNNKLQRHLRFQYPTALFAETVFEIDDEGNPFYITPVKKVKWVGLLTDIKGAIITNPITGESTYYDVKDVPKWVDHVYPSNLIIEQADDWGTYQDGWLNSFIGQKNVKMTTDGYTYLADETDIYIYTGITSATRDESNIGFILVNLRTKDAKFYPVAGAEEYSAMSSAQGAIQEKGYISTFPLLINLNNRATYLSSLKDSAGLVKAYAFIDVQDYQKVKVSESDKGLPYAAKAYLQMLGVSNKAENLNTQHGTITALNVAVIDGNTTYFIKLNDNDTILLAPITIDHRLPFLTVGNTISYTVDDDTIQQLIEIQP